MKKILFPTDLSKAAEQAFIYALHLADKLGASLNTLHVYRKPEVRAGGLPHTLAEFYESYDLDEFQNFKDAIPELRKIQEKQGFNHLNVQHQLEPGRTVETILDIAKKDNYELIVMGTTGARGLKEIFMGSVAGEVLENAHCPVLAIPEEAEFDGEIDDIAFTVSFQDDELKGYQKLLEIISPFHANIHCLNVDLAHTEEITHRMDQFKKALHANESGNATLTFKVLDGTDVREALTDYMEEHSVDILAMVTHKRNFFEELFRYSRAKEMSYHSNMPILSIPAHILEA
jgi:nucleotide-binding universal stress UspA family protein